MRGNHQAPRHTAPAQTCVNMLCKLTARFVVRNDAGDFIYSCGRHLAYNCEVMPARPSDSVHVRWLGATR